MTPGIPKTNTVRVADCLEWHLQQLQDDLLYPRGLCVDRSRDPRLKYQNKPEEYRDKAALVRIKLGDFVLDRAKSLGRVKRKHQKLILYCVQTITDDQDAAGLTVDIMQDGLRHAIEWELFNDVNLGTAAAALNVIDATFGSQPPSCIALVVDEMQPGPVTTFPDCYMALVLSYQFDEFGPSGVAGHG